MNVVRKAGKHVCLFAVGVALAGGYAERASALTAVEMQYLPAVQLVEGQSSHVTVTNVTTSDITAAITVFRANGTVWTQKTEVIAPGTTFTLPVKAPATRPLSFHTTISLDTANGAVSDTMTFDKNTGEANLLLPAVRPDTN